jgi:7-dehydrocholesterol reductase
MRFDVRRTVGPLLLMGLCPMVVMLFWYIATILDGSFSDFIHQVSKQGFFSTLKDIWGPYFLGTALVWRYLILFGLLQALLLVMLPGESYEGPMTAKGNIPIYTDNGLLAYGVTLTLAILLHVLDIFPLYLIYDHFGALLGTLNIFAFAYCLFLCIKGLYFPSSTDCGTTHNRILDFYWGTELYPRLWRLDLKQWSNCRMGMMGWAIILLSYLAKQKQLYGLSNSLAISVILQLVYITKFFAWERGYMRSMDIMHDRAGFYICWGCLVWVPCIYTSASLYMVAHPVQLHPAVAGLVLLSGLAAIGVNYWADWQRMIFRQTKGACKIWGKKPQMTHASYHTLQGKEEHSLLLASGFWGLSRHFHYLPEILAAFCWSATTGFSSFLPFFYVSFLTVLLFDRAHRDELRCQKKYKKYWDEHKRKVPYKIIPYLY